MWNRNPLHDFHKICRVCAPFQDALGVKIWLDLLKGLWSYGLLSSGGLVTPKFSAPPSGETMHQTPIGLEVQERAQGPLITMGVKFGTEEGTKEVPSSVPNFTPIGAMTRV